MELFFFQGEGGIRGAEGVAGVGDVVKGQVGGLLREPWGRPLGLPDFPGLKPWRDCFLAVLAGDLGRGSGS